VRRDIRQICNVPSHLQIHGAFNCANPSVQCLQLTVHSGGKYVQKRLQVHHLTVYPQLTKNPGCLGFRERLTLTNWEIRTVTQAIPALLSLEECINEPQPLCALARQAIGSSTGGGTLQP
jgi:hypothetical protein